MTAYSDVSGLKFEEANVSLGDELRAGRAARGLSLADVEADLRIKTHYIDAIESGNLSALPGKVYVDGFVRNYASYLGLDPSETLTRFDAETGFASTEGAARRRKKDVRASTAPANPLAGYNAKRPKGGGSGEVGRTIAALWPIVVLAGLGYGIWYGIMAAREAGIIPDNLSVIGAAEDQQPVFTANISDDEIGRTNGDDTIERPADLSYARLGTPPYWTLPERDDGPVSEIDIASAGLFASHRDMIGGSAMVRSAAPLDLTIKPVDDGVEDIAAQTRAALLAPAADPVTAPEVQAFKDYALVATEETWIEVKTATGGISFSGILAPGESYDIPADSALSLKVGNAGGLVLELEGKRLGPFGGRGVVMRRIDLRRAALSERFADNTSIASAQ